MMTADSGKTKDGMGCDKLAEQTRPQENSEVADQENVPDRIRSLGGEGAIEGIPGVRKRNSMSWSRRWSGSSLDRRSSQRLGERGRCFYKTDGWIQLRLRPAEGTETAGKQQWVMKTKGEGEPINRDGDDPKM